MTMKQMQKTIAPQSWHQASAQMALDVAVFYQRFEREIDNDVELHAKGLMNAILNDLRPQDAVIEVRACVDNFAAYWEQQLDEIPKTADAP